MRKYGKWALTLGLLAAMPGLTFAAGEAKSPRTAGKSGSASPNQAKAEEIANALKAAGIKGRGIDLEFNNGVAMISGQVGDAAMKAKAESAMQQVPGVTRVSNQLTVAQAAAPKAPARPEAGGVVQAAAAEQAGPRRSQIQKVSHSAEQNQAMAEQIGGALGAAGMEGYDIRIGYTNGVCTLTGNVDSPDARAHAERIVRECPGVEQVSNQLRAPGMMGPGPGRPGPGPGGPGQYGYPAMPAGYNPGGAPGAPGMPAPPPGYGYPGPGAGQPMYNQPSLPEHAWPTYAQYPNYAAVTYPSQYSASAFPYMGPFYPYPQVPMGWRDANLRWDDGQWNLQFNQRTERWWWFLAPKNW